MKAAFEILRILSDINNHNSFLPYVGAYKTPMSILIKRGKSVRVVVEAINGANDFSIKSKSFDILKMAFYFDSFKLNYIPTELNVGV